MKKLLKLIITACMLVTCFTVNVFAETEPENLVIESDDMFTGGSKECGDFSISSSATLILKKNEEDPYEAPHITVHGDIDIDGTLTPCQDAMITIVGDYTHNVSGIDFFDETGSNKITTFNGYADFIYIENDETTPINKWVQYIPPLEDIVFSNTTISTMDNPDHILYEWYEYNNVTVESSVYVKLADKIVQDKVVHCVLYIHGDYSGSGLIFGDTGAHLLFDHVENAFGDGEMGSRLYDSNGNNFAETPNGFMEFEYDGEKWKQFIEPQIAQIVEIQYEEEKGEVYHYVGETLTYIQQTEDIDDAGSHYRYIYNIAGDDTFYIKAKPGYKFDHIEAEGDDPQSQDYPGNRIINEENLEDANINGTIYKAVKVTTNPKDDNFYFIRFEFTEDLETKLVNELKTLNLALDKNADSSDLKNYVGGIIYSTYIDSGSRKHLNTIFNGDTLETFKEKIIIINDETEPSVTPITIDNTKQTDYFKYSLTGVDGFVGVVYKINGKDKFILRDGDTYTTIDVTTEGSQVTELEYFNAVGNSKVVTKKVTNTVNVAEERPGGNYEIFGNYACFPANETGLMHDGQDTSHISIEIVRASNNEYSALDCVLILYTEDFVGISVKSDEKAEPWNRENLPFYAINSGEEEASVFYMSNSIEITKPYGSPDNSSIVDINFENGEKSWKDCSITKNLDNNNYKLEFGSIFYDRIPIFVKFSNDEIKKVTIVRTGLMAGDYPAPGGSNSVDVFGTIVELEEGKRWLIATQFYYDEKDSEKIERVKLFVKITYDDGSIERKLVESPINENIINDESGNNYKFFDVFELWRGDGDARPKKIETIVFDDVSDDTFGGVKLGSGNGSRWLRERGRQ